MSYSITLKAASKAAALAAMAAKLDEMIATHQPIHARDRAAILANAESVLGLLEDDETKDVSIHCNGYMSWSGAGSFEPATAPVSSAAISFSAGLVAKEG